MASTSKHTPRSVLDSFYQAEREYMSIALEKRDFGILAATLSPDIRMEQTSALPYAGLYIGHEGMQDWIRRMSDYFDVLDVQNPEVFEQEGSNRIVVLSNLHMRVEKTGQELDFPFAQSFTVDLDNGFITELRSFYWDVQALNKAVGYTP